METIRGIQSIKLYAIESERLSLWNRIFTRRFGAGLKANRMENWWHGLDNLGTGIENMIIYFVGAKFVIDGSMSIGLLLCFVTYKDKFVEKFLSFVAEMIQLFSISIHLERLSDLILQDPEEVEEESEAQVLEGNLKVEGLNFRYSSSSPLLFRDLNLDVKKGQSIAIVGGSGSGKTTLMKILLGLIEPHSGGISVDGLSIARHKKNYRASIATVMQDDTLLSGTIFDNIAFFTRNGDPQMVIAAAKAACIHDDISNMPLGYQSHVSDFSNNISGGQKQRILIARAIYRRPKIMFMDEATSALDVRNERKVNEAIRNLGITRIIIAHRQETIDQAERVVRINNGQLVEMERGIWGPDHGRQTPQLSAG